MLLFARMYGEGSSVGSFVLVPVDLYSMAVVQGPDEIG